MWDTKVLWLDAAVVLGIFAVGSILFGHFEEHRPKWRRVLKLVIVLGVVLGLSATVGRAWAYGVLALPLLGALVIHTWWLPQERRERMDGRAEGALLRADRPQEGRSVLRRVPVAPARVTRRRRKSSACPVPLLAL